MRPETKSNGHRTFMRRTAGVAILLVSVGGMGSATALAASYSLNETRTRTLTVSQDTSITHSLTAATGLSDGSVTQDTVLATGTFSGTASQYGFSWDSRDASCDPTNSIPVCSRVKNQNDPNSYIDVIAKFPPSIVPRADPTLVGFVVLDLGTATAGEYTLSHMTAAPVKAGKYQMTTNIGVYIP